MKKWIIVMLAIVVVGAIAGAIFLSKNTNDDVVYASSISIANHSKTFEIGDNFTISNGDVDILPSNTTEKPIFLSSNSLILSVNAVTGFCECLSKGTANIVVKIKTNTDKYISSSITIVVEEQIVFPTNVQLEKTLVEVPLGLTAENKLIMFGNNVNVKPIVTSLNGNTNYNYQTGVVTPIKIGTDVITIKIPKSKTDFFELSFSVTITTITTATQNKTLKLGETTNIMYETINSENIEPMINYNSEFLFLYSTNNYAVLTVTPLKIGITQIVVSASSYQIIINITITE